MTSFPAVRAPWALVFLACACAPTDEADGAPVVEADTDTDADSDTDTDADSDTDPPGVALTAADADATLAVYGASTLVAAEDGLLVNGPDGVFLFADPWSARTEADAATVLAWTYDGSGGANPGGVAAADFDGDGEGDVAIGWPYSTYGGAWVFRGPFAPSETGDTLDAVLTGEGQFSYAGQALAAAQVDGTGPAELVVGARMWSDRGAVYVVAGPAGELGLEAASVRIYVEDVALASFGAALAAGDLDGDGRDEVVVGAPAAHDFAGAAFVFAGDALDGELSEADAEAVIRGSEEAEGLGLAVASLGDLDGDGHGDIAVGSQDEADGPTVAIFHGPVAGALAMEEAAARRWASYGSPRLYAFSIAAGNVDGDASRDVLVGAPYEKEENTYHGSAYVLLGPIEGTGSLRATAAAYMDGTGDDYLGVGAILADYDGDGLADVGLSATGASAVLLFGSAGW